MHAVLHGRQVLAAAVREQRATPRGNTVARVLRLWVALTLAACGGSPRGDTYARASQQQEQCCESLSGPTRDDCLRKLVRVEDPQVAKTSTNQDQYACVSEHFVCDPTTGHATQQSAQAQLDCIQDLDGN
ncbi:MAG TPA: hypothetical protein VIV11_37200 [Kofleriaceae bacterium]